MPRTADLPYRASCIELVALQEFVYEYTKIILSVMTSSPEPYGKVNFGIPSGWFSTSQL